MSAIKTHVGKEVLDFFALPFDMVEDDRSICVEVVFYVLQSGFKSPAGGNFIRMRSVEKLFGWVDEDLGISFDFQRFIAVILGYSEALLESFQFNRIVGIPTYISIIN